jgi:hypothetical protein
VVLENAKLQDRLRQFETLEDPATGTIHRYKETRKQLDALKDELFRIETCKIPNVKGSNDDVPLLLITDILNVSQYSSSLKVQHFGNLSCFHRNSSKMVHW